MFHAMPGHGCSEMSSRAAVRRVDFDHMNGVFFNKKALNEDVFEVL